MLTFSSKQCCTASQRFKCRMTHWDCGLTFEENIYDITVMCTGCVSQCIKRKQIMWQKKAWIQTPTYNNNNRIPISKGFIFLLYLKKKEIYLYVRFYVPNYRRNHCSGNNKSCIFNWDKSRHVMDWQWHFPLYNDNVWALKLLGFSQSNVRVNALSALSKPQQTRVW